MTREAPYPADTRAKGWRFELDYEQIEQSSTWALAGPEGQAWALKLWLTAWRQVPCGSLPADEEVIAAMLGMQPKQWAKHRRALMRGWWEADDGRLYHETISRRVAEMLRKRRSDAERQAKRRDKDAGGDAPDGGVTHADVTRDKHATTDGLGRESSTDHRIPNTNTGGKPPEPPRAPREGARARPAATLIDRAVLVRDGLTEQAADEWIAHRKRCKAALTPLAWDGIKAEASKAGWTPQQAVCKAMERGWRSFEARFVADDAPVATPRRRGEPEQPGAMSVHGQATARNAAALEQRLFGGKEPTHEPH